EQSRSVEVARAIDAPDGQTTRRRRPEEPAGGADLVRLRPCGDAARNRHRASRAGAVPRHSELPDGARTERFAGVYRSARGSGSGADRSSRAGSGPSFRSPVALRLRRIQPTTETILPIVQKTTTPMRTH